ncbi:alpha-ketoacid dehydrogenase subunit beta [Alkalihalobacillus macyae]|uniref:alpha-ketoacid dehydrogenase subunit beta n=1 Tax=Guptibacillus hwajinpoensis TaxID=208199 RepID=UPI00273AD532|nr:alpha-ketoacid dehydrogenase subunit beta [Alkalihalobacillus macyae]MDP4551790.1 alpha-ketoacid dehydrogenase subunit beta [Alkalihalobacillus macyae]
MSIAVNMKKMTMVQAITEALKVMLEEDASTLVIGEDVGRNGGVFRATDGLFELFGDDRVIDTPLAESGLIGTSIGLAMNGFKPVVEIQFLGFIYPGFNQLITHATRIRTRTQSRYTVPLTIRVPYGAGVRAPEIHSDSTEALFTHIPGLKVVVPSTPHDAKGMLISSIKDPDPVLFLEPMKMYRSGKGDVPTGSYTIPLGKAFRRRKGEDVSIFAWGAMVRIAEKAAETAAKNGIECDVIDLRTLYPLDKDMIAESVQKTGRAVIIHEAPSSGGVGSEVITIINDTSFLYMKAPIKKVTGYDTPVPLFTLEDDYLPDEKKVVRAIEETVRF